MALAPDESGIWGGQKWHLHTEKLHFCGFQGEQRGQKGGIYRGFSLQNGCSGRGCLNNICIVSYGVGAKFFTTNLISVDLPQNTPKTRKPIAERTSHKCHGTHRTFLQRKDSHGWHGWTQILRVRCSPTEYTEYTEFGSVGMAGMPYPPNLWTSVLICGRLFSARRFRVFRAFCGNIFSPTDGTDEHRLLWCAVLPQNSQNTQNLAAWVWQGCHTLLICEHPCSSVGGSSLPEGSVCSVRSAGISFLPRMARMNTDCYGALFSHRIHRIHRIWQRGYGRDAIPS